MRWQLRWRRMGMKGWRGMTVGISVHWSQWERIMMVDWGQVRSPSILLRCPHLLPFIFLSPLPFPLSPVHSRSRYISSCLLRVSSGTPICSPQGVTQMMEGRWSLQCSHRQFHFPRWALKIQLSISATQPSVSFHRWPMATNKGNVCGAQIKNDSGEDKRRE